VARERVAEVGLSMPTGPHYRAAPAIVELGQAFYDPVSVARFPQHVLRFRNDRWAARVGLASLDAEEWETHFAKFEPLLNNLTEPLALRYHGHQFRSYNPNLGDGRGFLFAQLRDGCDGRLLDLGTKGSGRTPYSRGGDGRLTLKGGLREVLATEMLEALGVVTSKSLSLFETGEQLMRGDEPSPTRSCVLTRLSHSHLRIGTFQRLAYMSETDNLSTLLEHCIRHYDPELIDADSPAAFLEGVARRSASLCARWMSAGFVHGVLNTDNINITGESFDYGPYRFLPHFDPEFTAAYFDHGKLYAFGRQPETMRWNIEQLAKALRSICHDIRLETTLSVFDEELSSALANGFIERLGLQPRGRIFDGDLLRRALDFLESSRVGYDGFFFDWYGGEISRARAMEGPRAAFYAGDPFDMLRQAWSGHDALAPERLELPYFQRGEPCTLLIDEIEKIWSFVDLRDDWSPFSQKLSDIRELAAAYGRAMVPAV
jgi:uncharacterized protein YdiU (UPF0061 family)